MTLESQALIRRCDGALVLRAGGEGMHFARTDGSTAVWFWGCALVGGGGVRSTEAAAAAVIWGDPRGCTQWAAQSQ
mgnify:CR=1 FL=1